MATEVPPVHGEVDPCNLLPGDVIAVGNAEPLYVTVKYATRLEVDGKPQRFAVVATEESRYHLLIPTDQPVAAHRFPDQPSTPLLTCDTCDTLVVPFRNGTWTHGEQGKVMTHIYCTADHRNRATVGGLADVAESLQLLGIRV